MANQIAIAGNMVGVCESLIYGMNAGLDLQTMLSSISQGAAGSWSMNNLAPRIINNNFEPGFFVDHFVKDMEIVLEETQRMEIRLPGLNLVLKLYKKLQEMGYGRKGTQSLFQLYVTNNKSTK